MHSRDLHRLTIDGVGRIYSNGEDLWLPSVSTVLDMRPTPEALKRWKRQTDNYEEVMHYKQNRGTLVHAELQEELVPTDPSTGNPVEEIWGKDEDESVEDLKEAGEWERFQNDLDWAKGAWDIIKKVANFDAVLDVETFVANTDIGYAGQFDLLYQDQETDETVLADLKTSKGVYEKHILQCVAYSHAVPISIDRMEVIRLNPDRKDWKIHSSHDWERDPDDLWDEFCGLRAELEKEKLETIVETIKDADADEEGVMREEM